MRAHGWDGMGCTEKVRKGDEQDERSMAVPRALIAVVYEFGWDEGCAEGRAENVLYERSMRRGDVPGYPLFPYARWRRAIFSSSACFHAPHAGNEQDGEGGGVQRGHHVRWKQVAVPRVVGAVAPVQNKNA